MNQETHELFPWTTCNVVIHLRACWFILELFISGFFLEKMNGKNTSRTKAAKKVGGHRSSLCKQQSSVLMRERERESWSFCESARVPGNYSSAHKHSACLQRLCDVTSWEEGRAGEREREGERERGGAKGDGVRYRHSRREESQWEWDGECERPREPHSAL